MPDVIDLEWTDVMWFLFFFVVVPRQAVLWTSDYKVFWTLLIPLVDKDYYKIFVDLLWTKMLWITFGLLCWDGHSCGLIGVYILGLSVKTLFMDLPVEIIFGREVPQLSIKDCLLDWRQPLASSRDSWTLYFRMYLVFLCKFRYLGWTFDLPFTSGPVFRVVWTM